MVSVRVSVDIANLVQYTVYEAEAEEAEEAEKAVTAPWNLVRDYFMVGADEANVTSADLRVRVLTNGRAPWTNTLGAVWERAPHLKRVEIVFDHVRKAWARGTEQVEVEQVEVEHAA